MTTIATDGVTIAAEGRTTTGREIVNNAAHKVHYLPDGSVVAQAGTCTAARSAMDELADAIIEGRAPKLCKGDYTLLRLTAGGQLTVYWSELTPVKLPTPYAMGSGGEFARGAMAAGASPVEAVRIACKFDSCSGGRVRSLTPKVPK